MEISRELIFDEDSTYFRSRRTHIQQVEEPEETMLVVEPDLLDPEILLSCVCTPGVLYTHYPCLGMCVRQQFCGPMVLG